MQTRNKLTVIKKHTGQVRPNSLQFPPRQSNYSKQIINHYATKIWGRRSKKWGRAFKIQLEIQIIHKHKYTRLKQQKSVGKRAGW